MIAELLALSSALFYGIRGVIIKKGLAFSNPLSATLVNLIASFIIQLVLLVFFFPTTISNDAVVYFLIAGVFLCTPFILGPISIHKLGVSITEPIQNSYSMFSTIMALIILHETFSPLVYVGIGMVIIGLTFLSHKGKSASNWKRIELLYPLGSAITIAATITFKKLGLNVLDAPVFASFVATTAALGLFVSFLLISKKFTTVSLNRRSLTHFSLSGISYALATTILAYALRAGELTIVTPLSSTSSLFALVLSFLFLKDEVLTRRLVLSLFLIIIGVILISAFH